jgi:hypothetical protein
MRDGYLTCTPFRLAWHIPIKIVHSHLSAISIRAGIGRRAQRCQRTPPFVSYAHPLKRSSSPSRHKRRSCSFVRQASPAERLTRRCNCNEAARALLCPLGRSGNDRYGVRHQISSSLWRSCFGSCPWLTLLLLLSLIHAVTFSWEKVPSCSHQPCRMASIDIGCS